MFARGVSVVLALTAALAAPAAAQCVEIFADDFDDQSLDARRWQVVLPYGYSSVQETGGVVVFTDRGYLVSVPEIDPLALGGIVVRGTWTIQQPNEYMQVCTRSDGVPDGGPYYEVRNGLCYGLWGVGTLNGLEAIGRGWASVGSTQMVGNITAIVGATYAFEVEEHTDWAIFKVAMVGNPQNSAVLTVTGITSQASVNRLVLYNRESIQNTHVTWLDDVTVCAPALCSSPVGQTYCFGNGSGTGCPCGNQAITCSGCANSTGLGAALTGDGSASVAMDDLVMTAHDLPWNTIGIFFMGGSGASVPFGDGLLCVGSGGTGVYRYFPQFTGPSGAVSLGPGIIALTQATLPPGGQIAAGDTWYFQAWFRDPSGPCGTTFNLSNGLAVSFEP